MLHLGCVDYPITRERIRRGDLLHLRMIEIAKLVYGVDSSLEGIAYLRNDLGLTNLILGNVEALESLSLPDDFDVIVAGELLEHLSNPGRFLEGVRALCGEDTVLVVSVPNAFSLKSFLRVACGRELVHSDHVAYHSLRTVTALLDRFGFHLISVSTYLIRSDSLYGRPLQILPHILVRTLAPYLADGLIVVAAPERG